MPRFREPILKGVKNCTTRTSKLAAPGDVFFTFGREFQVNRVWGTSLGIVASQLFKREGVSSEEEFIDVWKLIHPRRGFDRGALVYVHEFSPVDPSHPYPERPCRDCSKPFTPTLTPDQFQCVDCIEKTTPHDERDEGL
jgi:hypothetical protein